MQANSLCTLSVLGGTTKKDIVAIWPFPKSAYPCFYPTHLDQRSRACAWLGGENLIETRHQVAAAKPMDRDTCKPLENLLFLLLWWQKVVLQKSDDGRMFTTNTAARKHVNITIGARLLSLSAFLVEVLGILSFGCAGRSQVLSCTLVYSTSITARAIQQSCSLIRNWCWSSSLLEEKSPIWRSSRRQRGPQHVGSMSTLAKSQIQDQLVRCWAWWDKATIDEKSGGCRNRLHSYAEELYW